MSAGGIRLHEELLGWEGEVRGLFAASRWGCVGGGVEGVMEKVCAAVIVAGSNSILSGTGRNWFERLLPFDGFFFLAGTVEGDCIGLPPPPL